jgi:hypothetical protein
MLLAASSAWPAPRSVPVSSAPFRFVTGLFPLLNAYYVLKVVREPLILAHRRRRRPELRARCRPP